MPEVVEVAVVSTVDDVHDMGISARLVGGEVPMVNIELSVLQQWNEPFPFLPSSQQ